MVASAVSWDPNGYEGIVARMTRKGTKMTKIVIGVDISKDALDANCVNNTTYTQFTNGPAGWRAFITWARNQMADLVCYEPTGPYHRGFERAMLEAKVPISKVNPLYARRFAEATGRLAKTDQIDASVLARMGTALEPRLVEASNVAVEELKEFNLARRGLAKNLRAENNRLKVLTIPSLKMLCRRRIRQIEAQMKVIQGEISKLIRQDSQLSRRFKIIASIPGISLVSGSAILAEMPELGTLEGKAVASLAGLAPMNRESGLWKGRSSIRGGRSELRRSLYMPALVAIRRDPAFKKRYAALREKGKPGKVAVVAIMRKMLITANALIRDDREWKAAPPA